jgi:choline dehydrogenase
MPDVDVIVVGGGAAGCVVARRLADAGRSVLLLEAGPDRRADPPPGFRDGWVLPQEYEWGYMSETMPSGEPQRAWRIKLLGGTGWLTRFAVRGSPADYDAWGESWRFDDVLPYFKRLERDLDFGHEPWHGESGPMPVTRYLDLEHTVPTAAAFEALQASGVPFVDDHNRPGAVGAGRIPFSSLDGNRVTTADAYLPPDETPPNLAIRADTHVDRVVFDGESAIGVRLADGTVVQGGQVVLCAGAFGSAPILLRSGIGPPDELRSLGIDVRADSPGVGANLADHAGVEIDVGYGKESRAEPILHVIASFHSSSVPSDEPPDLLLWLSDPVPGGQGAPAYMALEALLMRPRSRGRVSLRSADPTVPPRLELPQLDDQFDVDRLAEAYARALEVVNHAGLRAVCAAEPSGAPDPDDAEALCAWIRSTLYSYPHVAGTCAMGSVVDTNGRVHGTERLTVGDASIMPDMVSGFTHFPTIMIAERLAEQIAP